MNISRRKAVGLIGAASMLSSVSTLAQSQGSASSAVTGTFDSSEIYDQIGFELVMNINVICSEPESMGPEVNAADGIRDVVWPIVGGRFSGPGISGRVLPGGGDFPVTRPDGGVIIDALYRLQTDDGYQIIIHNKGLGYAAGNGVIEGIYRLTPVFNVSGDKYSWLRESTFVSTLTFPTPEKHKIPMESGQNDRLIQVFRLT